MARSNHFAFFLRALNSPNYRLFFGGQLISLTGTWLTIVATQWLVYRLAQHQYPHREAGVWIDRLNTHRIIVITQFLSMLLSFALAFLALRRLITIPQLIALNACKG